MIKAPPPSEITQQSSLWSGSATSLEFSTSSTVIASRYMAFGLRPAYSLTPTAISASCSDVVPIFVHMAAGGHGVGADQGVAVRRLVLRRALHVLTVWREPARPEGPSHAGQEVGSVGDEDRVAQALPDGRSRVLYVELERRSPGHGPIDVAMVDRRDTQPC